MQVPGHCHIHAYVYSTFTLAVELALEPFQVGSFGTSH